MLGGMAPLTALAARPRTDGLKFVGAMAALMWVVETVDVIDGGRLDRFGIRPRDAEGLTGIVTAPFLHAGFGHLLANTVPFLVLGATIALSGLVRVLRVTAIVAVVSGLGTWLVASSSSVHIGASGVVFGYGAYLLARGFFDRRVGHIAIGLVVGVLWGGALLVGLLPHPGISWQGHVFGALGGVLAAGGFGSRSSSASGAPRGLPA